MSVGSRGGNFQQGRSGTARGAGSGGHSDQFPLPSPQDLQAIIQHGDAEKLVEVAERVGSALARPPDSRDQLTSSQIRNIFGAVREIEMSWPRSRQLSPADQEQARRCHRELLLLRPKLAYQARRASGRGVENLRGVLDPAIKLVAGDRERFQNFVDLFEAILAYHRAYGGQ